MKRNYKLYIGLAALALAVTSCKPEFKEDASTGAFTSGQANFSKYISVGNSLTSGFADGGLYRAGQLVAFPNLIAEQMKRTGGGEFTSPLFSVEQENGSGYIQLASLVNGVPGMKNIDDKLAYRSASPKLLTKYTDPINNLGVPGMRLDLAFFPGFGSPAGNMYFERLLKDDELSRTYFDFATKKDHTFFSFWLGNNDVLGYAMNGAVADPTDPTTTLTATATFTKLYNDFISALTEGGKKGVVATIPDVTAVPFFTTVTSAALLAGANAARPQGIPAFENIYIATKNGPRAATNKDLFVLPFSSAGLLGTPNAVGAPYGLHPINPVEDKYVLDEAEVKEVTTRTNEFNTVIKNVAAAKELALADAHDFLNKTKVQYDQTGKITYNGLNMNGIIINNLFISGNAFSLDGIHLTPIGNAIIANVFIDAINKKYSSNVPNVNYVNYPGVKMPEKNP